MYLQYIIYELLLMYAHMWKQLSLEVKLIFATFHVFW